MGRQSGTLTALSAVLMVFLSMCRGVSAKSEATRTKSDVTRQAALAVGVKPQSCFAPRILKRFGWKWEGIVLRILSWCDSCSPPDSKLSLRVLWWKAIADNTRTSPVYDELQLINDLFPSPFQWLVKWPLNMLYPRWTHVIVEIRTAYLNQVIQRIRDRLPPTTSVCLVSMGGGYDVRSLKLLLNGTINEAVELDLPKVIQAKQRLLERLAKRQRRRRPKCDLLLPTCYPLNLTDIPLVQSTLTTILTNHTTDESWFTIFLFEGVLMYLPPDVPSQLFLAIRHALTSTTLQDGCIVFADDLQFVPNDSIETARQELAQLGWNVTEWLPKGGRTRHMGCVERIRPPVE